MDKPKVKPLFLVLPGSMSPRDIRRIERLANIVVVECKDPNAVRLLEPPVDYDMPAQARAALSLARMIIDSSEALHATWSKGALIQFFTRALMYQPPPTQVKKIGKV